MIKKRLSSILLFSLLTLVICNNVKASELGNDKELNDSGHGQVEVDTLIASESQKRTLLTDSMKSTGAQDRRGSSSSSFSKGSSDLAGSDCGGHLSSLNINQESQNNAKAGEHLRLAIGIIRGESLPSLDKDYDKILKENEYLRNKTRHKELASSFSGLAKAAGAEYALSLIGKAGKLERNPCFKEICEAVKDSRDLQGISCFATVGKVASRGVMLPFR